MSCFSEKEYQLRQEAKHFSQEVIKPTQKTWDASGGFPRTWFQACGSQGLIGAGFPQEYGGRGMHTIGTVIALEQIARESASLGASLVAHMQCARFLLEYGSEEQKEHFVVPALKGDLLLAFSMTEITGGSDVLGIQTTAEHTADDYWILNGAKHWVSNGGEAAAYVLTARTNDRNSRQGFSLFLIEKDTPGFSIDLIEHKMGMQNLSTADLRMEQCKIPSTHLVGAENDGYDLSNTTICDSRLYTSAVAVGLAQAALDKALAYTTQREQYNRPITSNQGVSFSLAEMYTELQAARAFLYQIARERDCDHFVRSDTAALKSFCTDVCCRVCDKAQLLFGGNGYSKEYDVERFVRESRMLKLAAGTSEICKVSISNHLIYKGDTF